MDHQQERTLTRRDAIKRGVTLGAGVVWAVPTVQALGMSRAFANEVSPETGLTYYAIKIEQLIEGGVVVGSRCLNIEMGGALCFTPSSFPEPLLGGGCDRVYDDDELYPPEVDDGAPWVITLKPGCSFVDNESFVYIKSGQACVATGPDEVNPVGDSLQYVFSNDLAQDISHIEAIICCDPGSAGGG